MVVAVWRWSWLRRGGRGARNELEAVEFGGNALLVEEA